MRSAVPIPCEFQHLSGSQEFYELLWSAALMHHRKNQDYATPEDPFRNFRRGVRLGIRPYTVALLRLLEKMERVENLESEGKAVAVEDETIDDTLIDAAVLALIVIVLRKEDTSAAASSGRN